MTYSLDFRLHVLGVREKEGLTFAETSARFCVGIASLTRWSKSLEPKSYPLRMYKIDLDALEADVEKYPDSYQFERAERFGVRQNSIHQALKKLNVTYKKSPKTSEGRRRQTAVLPAKN